MTDTQLSNSFGGMNAWRFAALIAGVTLLVCTMCCCGLGIVIGMFGPRTEIERENAVIRDSDYDAGFKRGVADAEAAVWERKHHDPRVDEGKSLQWKLGYAAGAESVLKKYGLEKAP